ncbi:MAG: hypothetical protein U0271_44510 [Polyangiaceae bacterium]
MLQSGLAAAPRASRGRIAIGTLGLCVLSSTAVLSSSSVARAEGLLVTDLDSAEPVEQRVALAVAPDRSVLFTELTVRTNPGPLGIVLPVPPGASLDWASRAFFEALEECSSPRVIPFAGAVDRCPSGDSPVISVEGGSDEDDPLEPGETGFVSSPAELVDWAQARGLRVPVSVYTAMLSHPGEQFFVATFMSQGGEVRLPTVRVVSPVADSRVSLDLMTAGTSDVPVTIWALGEKPAVLDGETVGVDWLGLVLDLGPETSNYEPLIMQALGKGGPLFLTQMASHRVLSDTLPTVTGAPPVPSLTMSYISRLALYDEAAPATPSECVGQFVAGFGRDTAVGHSCPSALLGVAGGGPGCTPSFTKGEVDPAVFVCGKHGDDFGLALGGMVPKDATLSRFATLIHAEAAGGNPTVSFVDGEEVLPIVTAGVTSTNLCDPNGWGGQGPGDDTGDGGSWNGGDPDPNDPYEPYDPNVDFDWDSCSGSSSSGCDGSDADAFADACSGFDASGCSGFDASGCSGFDASGCSGFDAGGCSGGGGFDACSVKRGRIPLRPTAFIYGLLAVLTVSRRLTRKSARERRTAC